MDSHHKLPNIILLIWVIGAITAASQVITPDCQEKCGEVTIPYPFGTRDGCYLNKDFLITCDETSSPPKPRFGNIEVLNISVDGELRVLLYVAKDCYNTSTGELDLIESDDTSIILPRFPFSYTRNKFVAIGCDTYAVIQGESKESVYTGCLSVCNSEDSVSDGSCSGIGCCQTSIPKGILNYNVSVTSYNNHSSILDFNPCSYSFLAEEDSFNFSKAYLKDFNRSHFPAVRDWAVGDQTCKEAMKNSSTYACKSNVSTCYDSDNGPGYRCNCSAGYQGNPYIPDGCKDVNECEDRQLHDCVGICINTNGSYGCSCKTGYHRDGGMNGNGCSQDVNPETLMVIKVAAGIAIAILALVFACGWLYWGIRQRNINKRREEYFELNGGIILQQNLASKDSDETVKIFTIEELNKATNDFDEDRVIGKGGFGTVYKGVLPKNKIVAIKKSKVANQIQSEQFANEFLVLSKINHRNVVRLLGCCLETEVPLLVYEFITNGTLSHHIHGGGTTHASMPWGIRLRVASETAGALAYLHSAAYPPIIHRDVKPANILLDENYTAKVSDFGDSRLIPVGQTELDTLVKGTIGYLDPEYLQTSQLSEKSDVYNFGVVLVELLTGEKAVSLDRMVEKRSLVAYFISSLKQNRLFQILDVSVANEGSAEQIREVAKIAESCLRMKGEERPTMKEVAMELEGLRRLEQHHFIEFEMNLEETKRLVNESSMDFCSSSTTTEFDSLKNQGLSPFDIDGGR